MLIIQFHVMLSCLKSIATWLTIHFDCNLAQVEHQGGYQTTLDLKSTKETLTCLPPQGLSHIAKETY